MMLNTSDISIDYRNCNNWWDYSVAGGTHLYSMLKTAIEERNNAVVKAKELCDNEAIGKAHDLFHTVEDRIYKKLRSYEVIACMVLCEYFHVMNKWMAQMLYDQIITGKVDVVTLPEVLDRIERLKDVMCVG